MPNHELNRHIPEAKPQREANGIQLDAGIIGKKVEEPVHANTQAKGNEIPTCDDNRKFVYLIAVFGLIVAVIYVVALVHYLNSYQP
jgi:hypothetical protein